VYRSLNPDVHAREKKKKKKKRRGKKEGRSVVNRQAAALTPNQEKKKRKKHGGPRPEAFPASTTLPRTKKGEKGERENERKRDQGLAPR